MAQSNGSGAADQADARLPGGKSAGEGRAFITGHEHRIEAQRLAGQVGAQDLGGTVLLNATGAYGCSSQWGQGVPTLISCSLQAAL